LYSAVKKVFDVPSELVCFFQLFWYKKRQVFIHVLLVFGKVNIALAVDQPYFILESAFRIGSSKILDDFAEIHPNSRNSDRVIDLPYESIDLNISIIQLLVIINIDFITFPQFRKVKKPGIVFILFGNCVKKLCLLGVFA
jgi:hypothetical protein